MNNVQEYIRTEEFYHAASKCFYKTFKKHKAKYFTYTTYPDLFVYGYIRFLEDMKDKTAFDFNNKEDRIFLFHSLQNGMFSSRSYNERMKKNTNFSSFITKEDDEKKLSYIFPEAVDKYNIEYSQLLELLKDFLRDYTVDGNTKKILYEFFKGKNVHEIKKDKTILGSVGDFVQKIREFRKAFADFLVDVGYLENSNYVLTELKEDKIREASKRYDAIKQGLWGLEEYLYDFLIYKLIREQKNINECAEILGRPVEYIENIVYHKNRYFKKLYLFEVQSLRKLFPNYTLAQLVECKVGSGVKLRA